MADRRHRGERGAAMVLVMTLLAALLAGASAVMFLSTGQTRTAGEMKRGLDATYCAEAGILQWRDAVAAVPTGEWPDLFAGNTVASLGGISLPQNGDIDLDGTDDYTIEALDNEDEVPPVPGDSDGKFILRSTCIKYPNTRRQIIEIVTPVIGPPVQTYDGQAGQGEGGTGNLNQ